MWNRSTFILLATICSAPNLVPRCLSPLPKRIFRKRAGSCLAVPIRLTGGVRSCSRAAAVRSQQAYARRKGVPWGVSESAYFKLDESGNYRYHAFGLPHLALRKHEFNGMVISPYSTFLALEVDPSGALRNLHRVADLGWFGSYGFYEAADYSSSRRRFWRTSHKL